jgi:hypothetical protein
MDPYLTALTPYTKKKLKMDERLNLRPNTINLLQEKPHNIGLGLDLSVLISKAQTIKGKYTSEITST